MKPNAEPRYPQLFLDVPPEEVEEASALLFELGAEGIEERDQVTLLRGAAPERTTLVASFADDAGVSAAMGQMKPEWSARAGAVVGEAWRDAYKAYFHPFRLTRRVVVFPPWEPAERERSDDLLLELEPGRAFGTGLHATTRGVAIALEEREQDLADAKVLDVGTGSGILLLVAAALGAKTGLGIDIDPDAVACARENAARNHMEQRLTFDTISVDSLSETYPWVLANIEAPVLIALAHALTSRVAKGGRLVLAGVLVERRSDVVAAYPDLSIEAEYTDGEWIAIVLHRPS